MANIPDTVVERSAIRENKLELVERLADDLAHEIKNPLHSMVINLEVMRRRIARLEQGGEELLRYAGVLSSELERVNRRVDLLLRLLRPNSEPDEPATLPEVIEELRELVDLECERHGVSLAIELPPDLLRTRLPRAAARQVILSLFLKTLDALPAGSALHLRAEVEENLTHLHFDGLAAPDPEAAALQAMADEGYLQVANALAHRLGAELRTAPSSAHPESPDLTPQEAFVLAIPRC